MVANWISWYLFWKVRSKIFEIYCGLFGNIYTTPVVLDKIYFDFFFVI